jgi:hypothetical protein
MVNKKSGKRGSGIIALIAVIAALAGPSTAMADPGKSKGPADPAQGKAYAYSYAFGLEASWAEE